MKKQIICLLVVLMAAVTSAQNQNKRSENFNLDGKVAIMGYDPVAYFKGKPEQGKKELSATYQGVVYYFSTAANKEAFTKNPTGYEPQYGGWCAYAMGSSAEKVEINPETFKIVDGKLYLFYNAFFNNTLKSWNKQEATLKAKADANWKKFIK